MIEPSLLFKKGVVLCHVRDWLKELVEQNSISVEGQQCYAFLMRNLDIQIQMNSIDIWLENKAQEVTFPESQTLSNSEVSND
jgi:hypothetical protein